MTAEGYRLLRSMGCNNAEIAFHFQVTEAEVAATLASDEPIDHGVSGYVRASVAHADRVADLIPNNDALRRLYGR